MFGNFTLNLRGLMNLFRGGANSGAQNTRNPDHEIKQIKTFKKRTDYADYAFSGENNPYLEAVIKEMIANSVGGAGIQVTPQPLKGNGDIDVDLQKKLVKLWNDNKDHLDAGGRHGWAALNNLIAREVWGGGECFIVKIQSEDVPNTLDWGLMLKGYNAVPFVNKDGHLDGIKCNSYGLVQSYMFANGTKYKPVAASNVIHVANFTRIDDTRGYSAVAAACKKAVEIDQYDKDSSQLVNASKAMAYFVISEDVPGFPAGLPVVHIKGKKENIDVKALTSQLTNTYSKEHRKNLYRVMCASVGTGFGAVSGEFDGSYSASRQEVITAAQKDLARQQLIIDNAIQKIYEAFVLRCISRGLVTPSATGDIFNARYVAPRRDHIDPLKQAKAVALELATNQTSLSDVLASKGKDFDTYIVHLRDELRKLEQAGLQPNGVEALKFLELKVLEDESDVSSLPEAA